MSIWTPPASSLLSKFNNNSTSVAPKSAEASATYITLFANAKAVTRAIKKIIFFMSILLFCVILLVKLLKFHKSLTET